MEKRIVLSALALMVVGVCSSVAIAIPPMGPPRATLHEGQWSFGLEFGHGEMDLETLGPVQEIQYIAGIPVTTVDSYTKYEIKNLKSNLYLARLGAGSWENWDIFIRFGATDAQDEISEVLADDTLGDQYTDFEGSNGFAWGFGTRATFYQEGDITWGGLFQMTFSNPDGSEVIAENDSDFSGDVEIDFWEVQIAIGPTLELDACRLYGGPFLHFVNGDLDLNGTTIHPISGLNMTVESTHDIREESQFGGYVGAQWYLGENSSLYTEIQFTDDVWGVGVGSIWRF